MTRCFSIPRGASDLLKIISAILVVATHYLATLAVSGVSLNAPLMVLWKQGGNIGVAVFFFLSGYGLMTAERHRHLNLWQYIERRFLRVYLPVVLVTALWLPYFYDNINTAVHVTPAVVVKDLFFDFCDFILWFIRILLMLYVAFYIFAWQLSRGNRSVAFTLLWGMTAMACLGCYALYGSFGLAALSKIPLFTIGVIAAYYPDKFFGWFNYAFFPLAICFAVLSSVVSLFLNFDESVLSNMVTYSTIALILLVFTTIKPEVKVPAILAALSLDVYLVHYKVLAIINVSPVDLSLPLYIAAVAVVAVGFYFLRTRVQKFVGDKLGKR